LLLPLSIALLLTILGFILKVSFAIYLVFLFVSLLALTANLFVLARRAKSGLRFLGGYLTHFGVGLMFVGILTSSGYDQTLKINLPQDEAKEAFGYQFTYLGMEQDVFAENNVLNIKVQKGGTDFLARPRFYYSDYTQGIMRTPHIKINLLEDIYLAPVEHVDADQAGKQTLFLTKGEAKTIEGYEIKFVDFDMSTHQTESQISVGAKLEIQKDGIIDTLIPIISMDVSGQDQIKEKVLLPDGENAIVLEQIDADRKMVKLNLLKSEEEPQKDLLVLEVSRKPLINLLWLGTVLIMLGLTLSTYRRAKEAIANKA
jgi:cytochrome c-type biogenesis protein CcmF